MSDVTETVQTRRRLEAMHHHLAQINLARLIAPLDDPRIADFVAQLDTINALAEQSPGFVWRLQDESGNASWFYKTAHWSFPAVYDDSEKIEKAWNTSGAGCPVSAQKARTARVPPMPSSSSWRSRWSLPPPYSRSVTSCRSASFCST